MTKSPYLIVFFVSSIISVCGVVSLTISCLNVRRTAVQTNKRTLFRVSIAKSFKYISLKPLVGQLGLVLAIGLIISFTLGNPIALLVLLVGFGLFSRTLRVRDKVKKQKYLIDLWPEVLDDLRIRVGSLGIPLPQAFFQASKKFPNRSFEIFQQAERQWILEGSFAKALDLISESISDSTTTSITQTLALCMDAGGSDSAYRIAELRDAREAEKNLWGEINARLGAVRLARLFIIIVPLVMGVVGYLLSGSGSATYSGGALIALLISLLCIVGCWLWSSALMRPPIGTVTRPNNSFVTHPPSWFFESDHK